MGLVLLMWRLLVTMAMAMVMSALPALAGNLEFGTWDSSKCGPEPEPPGINDASPETYNFSMTLLKAWVDKAKAYESCVQDEAQRDTDIIHHAIQDEHQHMQARFDRLGREAKAAVDKLNGQRKKEQDVRLRGGGDQRQPTQYSTDPSQQGYQNPNSPEYRQQQRQQQDQGLNPGQSNPSAPGGIPSSQQQ
jgi:hypothetical protein